MHHMAKRTAALCDISSCVAQELLLTCTLPTALSVYGEALLQSVMYLLMAY